MVAHAPNRMVQISAAVVVVLAVSLPSSSGWASDKVFFDLSRTVPCCDVTTAEFLASNPTERLLEARFQISSLIRGGDDEDLIQFFYRFDGHSPGIEVVGYLPQTTLSSDVAGSVGVQQITEDSHTLGLAVTGAFDHIVSGTGSGNVSSKNTTNIQYDLLPPMAMVAASGTVNRRTGVYFKLKPTARTSLEGGKEFVVVLRVPQSWRGDIIQVLCHATGYRNSSAPPFEERGTIGKQRFVVALYLEGDERAKQLAHGFANCEQQLRNIARANRREIEKRAYPTAAHRFGKIFPGVEPKIPADWLERVVYAPLSSDLDDYTERLPEDVLAATKEFVAAKRELTAMSNE